ncbi:hypothetical protein HZ326_29782 [Fusarium oxysporum f. sp. albedinis]|nr:hypothetical protein HZ326_29782 [Fusarium oxysporum f. sp. albedinis]
MICMPPQLHWHLPTTSPQKSLSGLCPLGNALSFLSIDELFIILTTTTFFPFLSPSYLYGTSSYFFLRLDFPVCLAAALVSTAFFWSVVLNSSLVSSPTSCDFLILRTFSPSLRDPRVVYSREYGPWRVNVNLALRSLSNEAEKVTDKA